MRTVCLVALSIVLIGAAAASAGYGLGSAIPAFNLADQNGKKHRIDERVRVIVLSRDTGSGDVITTALARNGKRLLDKNRAVYLSDVSGTPSFLRRMFVLPKLQERSYPILLDVDGDISSNLPSRQGFATLIFLHRLRVASVEYVKTPEGLVASLEAPKRFAKFGP